MAQTRDDLERNLRSSPDQYKALNGVLVDASSASAQRANEIYDTVGIDLPPGPALFEIRALLLTDMLFLMAQCKQDREVFQAFNAFACHAMAFDLHPRLLANGDLAQIAGERVQEYWEINHANSDTRRTASDRASRLAIHLDAGTQNTDIVQRDHPVALYSALDHFQVQMALREHYIRTSLILAYPLKAVFEAAKDIRRLSIDEMGNLLDSGAETTRAVLGRLDDEER